MFLHDAPFLGLRRSHRKLALDPLQHLELLFLERVVVLSETLGLLATPGSDGKDVVDASDAVKRPDLLDRLATSGVEGLGQKDGLAVQTEELLEPCLPGRDHFVVKRERVGGAVADEPRPDLTRLDDPDVPAVRIDFYGLELALAVGPQR